MFDRKPLPNAPLTTAEITTFLRRLVTLDHRVEDVERVDQIRLLEELKSAAAAAQARVTTELVASQKGRQVEAGLPPGQVGRGIASQVALAKRESPARARRYVGWAGILVRELPETFTVLQSGGITEWRAMIVARETAWLSLEHRTLVDADVAPHLPAWGERQVEAEVRRRAYRLDPHGFIARSEQAVAARRVGLRPAPDTMTILTGVLPMTQGVAVYAALRRAADSARAAGDERSRGQVMADTLVERVTGQASAGAVPVEVTLVMTDRTLFHRRTSPAGPTQMPGRDAAADEPAHLEGYGPVPADLARRLLGACQEPGSAAAVWLRRVYTDPGTGELVGTESRRREFGDALRRVLIVRDQLCRTPWCDAPIRDGDHVVRAADGGVTSLANGQGLCAACNQAREAPGWSGWAPEGAGTAVETVTPTGHHYRSTPPGLPGSASRDPVRRPRAPTRDPAA